ncbi:MAG: helix-turn-helix domain-containing protein [Nitriliruptoraceae bacterium]
MDDLRSAGWMGRCVGRGELAPCSAAEIAGLLGTTRPSVNRVRKGLEEAGHVRIGSRRIEVVDPEALERIGELATVPRTTAS